VEAALDLLVLLEAPSDAVEVRRPPGPAVQRRQDEVGVGPARLPAQTLLGLLGVNLDLPLVVSRTGAPWLMEALSSVSPDRHRPDLHDEGSVYTHALDALRYYFVNAPDRGEPYPWSDYPMRRTVIADW
jgi:hypothetical protein